MFRILVMLVIGLCAIFSMCLEESSTIFKAEISYERQVPDMDEVQPPHAAGGQAAVSLARRLRGGG